MAANASGDTQSVSNTNKTISLTAEVSGPMGDAPQKRPLEDGEEPGAKKLASITPGSFSDSSLGIPNPGGVMSENMRLPDDLVGLIIGRKGENIMRMQRETGCRIQITQSMPGTKERPCTLSGTPEQIEVCRNMLNEIIARSQAGTLGNDFNLNPPGPNMGMGMGDGPGEKTVEIAIPAERCGLIIGKKGETIKMLQQNLHVKMLLVQDSTENLGQPKPLRVTGPPMQVDNAINAIHQMMAQRDKMLEQKMDPSMLGDETQLIPIPKAAVGVVIGKRGDMINQLQSATMTRIQFKPEEPGRPDRLCSITGNKEGVDDAIQRINQIIQNVQERDAGGGGRHMGMGGPPGGGMGGFGQWEGPGGNRDRGGMGVTTEEHLVPANKTGLVIGKGGETIKQINMQSGAHAEIQRNPPPGSDLNYKTFLIKGTPDQIKMCRQLIQEKVDSYVGGGGGNGMPGGGPMNGPPGHGPPPGNFGPPPQQNFGGMPPGANFAPPPNPMQAPPQAQQSFQQQPWANQFQQWTPSSVAAPQQNGANPSKPITDAYSAAWQNYLSAYQQNPVASAAPTATAAATVAQPDYSKQWDEYLKQTGAAQAAQAAAVAAQAAAAPAAAAAAQALQPQVAAAPTATPAAAPAAAAAQPATTQADYSAQWAEYYRQFYQLQGQQYAAAAAAAAGQAPAQT